MNEYNFTSENLYLWELVTKRLGISTLDDNREDCGRLLYIYSIIHSNLYNQKDTYKI